MTTAKKNTPSIPTNSYEQTRQMIEQARKTGVVTPLMNMLEKLLDDPTLRKTMEGMPVASGSPKRPEEVN